MYNIYSASGKYNRGFSDKQQAYAYYLEVKEKDRVELSFNGMISIFPENLYSLPEDIKLADRYRKSFLENRY